MCFEWAKDDPGVFSFLWYICAYLAHNLTPRHHIPTRTTQSKRRKAEEEAGDGAESEEEQGGFRPYLPMPPALARRRKAQGKQGGGAPAGGGNAAVKAQRAVEEWAAKGRCVPCWGCGVLCRRRW